MWATVAIRLVAVYIASSILTGVSSGYLMALLEPWVSGGDVMVIQLVVITIATAGSAVGLWYLAPWIASKIVSDYSGKCPKCRFSLEHFRADRCPECGLFLGEEFHAPLPSSSDSDMRVITTDSTPE